MNKTIARGFAAAALSALLGLPSAHAGLVTGDADPPFGAALPTLSYRAHFEFDLPDQLLLDAVANHQNTINLTNIFLTGWVQLYETNNEPNASGKADFKFALNSVTFDLDKQLLTDWTAPWNCAGCFSDMSALEQFVPGGERFYFAWQHLANPLRLRVCQAQFANSHSEDDDDDAIQGCSRASAVGLTADYKFFKDDGTLYPNQQKYTFNGPGRGTASSTQSGGGGGSSGSTVPEPASLGLAMAALAGLVWQRRTRQR